MTTIIILIALTVFYDFLNGMQESGNIVATVISSRAYNPRLILIVIAIAEFLGPFLFGVAVATTIGNDIVKPTSISVTVILAVLCSAILWNITSWYLRIPISSSHGLVGALIGAVAISSGFNSIQIAGLKKVIISLFVSPLVGFIAGFLLAKLVFFLSRNASPKINIFFKRAQIFTAISLAFSYGTNSAQKAMGIITLGLVAGGYLDTFTVPKWVIITCAGAIATGTMVGGWRQIKTLGTKFYKIRPVDGFNSQLASAIVILGDSLMGGPVSTTQVVSTTIMGAGSAERINKVRWGVARDISFAWLVAVPTTALVAAGIYSLLKLFIS